MSTRELLAEAIREEKELRVCVHHPRAVHYDERGCPCCRIEREVHLGQVNAQRDAESEADRKRREADRELKRMGSKLTP